MGIVKTAKDVGGVILVFDGGSEIVYRTAQQVRQFLETDMDKDDVGQLVEDLANVPRVYKKDFGKAGVGVVLLNKHGAIIRKIEEKTGLKDKRTVYVSTKTGKKIKAKTAKKAKAKKKKGKK